MDANETGQGRLERGRGVAVGRTMGGRGWSAVEEAKPLGENQREILSQTRRSSESLHAWAAHPFWACGASPSAFSLTWQMQPALRFSTDDAKSESAEAREHAPTLTSASA